MAAICWLGSIQPVSTGVVFCDALFSEGKTCLGYGGMMARRDGYLRVRAFARATICMAMPIALSMLISHCAIPRTPLRKISDSAWILD
jgi:hypothetical protein